MTTGLGKVPSPMSSLLDAIPSFIFLVDRDVHVLACNEAARKLASPDCDMENHPRGGEIFRCVHSRRHPDGCGRSEACQACVIRNSVRSAFGGGRVIRRRARIEVENGKPDRELHVMVTASLMTDGAQPQVLLLLEDISALMELRSILPICVKCKRVCADASSWMQVEAFFQRHFDMAFSHGFCPECADKEMKRLDKTLVRKSRGRRRSRGGLPD